MTTTPHPTFYFDPQHTYFTIDDLSDRDRNEALSLYIQLKNCQNTSFGYSKAQKIAGDWHRMRDFAREKGIMDSETGEFVGRDKKKKGKA